MERQNSTEELQESDKPLLDLEAGNGCEDPASECSWSCVIAEIV